MVDRATFEPLWSPNLKQAGKAVFEVIEPELDRIMREVYVFLLKIEPNEVTRDQIDRGHIKFRNILVGHFSEAYFETQRKTTGLLIEKGVDFVSYLLIYGIYHRECALCLTRAAVAEGSIVEERHRALHLALQCDASTSMHSYFDQLNAANQAERAETLTQSAAEIGNAVKMINTLSVQTNMLAVNAGIEAARAGEAGLGFAVVAREIQSMATKARQATAEIAAISDQMRAH
ncbi:MAG: methyl-accepting chemotaxis protein [Pseudomonadota bacterium]